MLAWYFNLFPRVRSKRQPEAVVLGPTGFRLMHADKLICEVAWTEINRIVAYKRDLLNTDLVCFDIERGTPENTRVIMVHEEVKGFELLDAEFSRRREGYRSDWREQVFSPAFAASAKTIYEAKSA